MLWFGFFSFIQAYYYDTRRFPRGTSKLGDCEWTTLRDVRRMIQHTAAVKAGKDPSESTTSKKTSLLKKGGAKKAGGKRGATQKTGSKQPGGGTKGGDKKRKR